MLGLTAWLILEFVPSGQVVRLGEFTVGPKAVGRALFTTYLLPFEVTSILILIAILGAIVLARKEI
jgi:NADH-quinone oxidoreductase subunit J